MSGIASSRRLIGFIIALLFTTNVTFAASLAPFTADYHVFKDGELVANTTMSLEQKDDSLWLFTSFSKPTGWFASIMGLSVTETSLLSRQGENFQVQTYRYDRTGKEKKVHLAFDWDKQQVSNTINGDLWKMDIPAGTYDKLSIRLALMSRIDGSDQTYQFPVADGGKLKTYEYRVIGNEALETAVGRLDTIKVNRNKVGRKDGNSTLWLAPSLNNLLVRIQKKESDGEVVTLEVVKLN